MNAMAYIDTIYDIGRKLHVGVAAGGDTLSTRTFPMSNLGTPGQPPVGPNPLKPLSDYGRNPCFVY